MNNEQWTTLRWTMINDQWTMKNASLKNEERFAEE